MASFLQGLVPQALLKSERIVHVKQEKKKRHLRVNININDKLTDRGVFTGKSQTKTLPGRPRFRIFPS